MNMPRINRLSAALLAASLTAPWPLAAQAQDPDADDDVASADAAQSDDQPASGDQLNTVTVTARKREETLQEVPVAVTAFTPDTLEKLNVRDLGDLDAQVPNLTIYAARGSSSTATAYIRGVGQADPLWGVDPGVGIYLDDVYIARPQGALLDVFDVGRIEVLRGPQGTLYGKNTIGGAIKYISRVLPTETTGFAEVTVGNHSQLDVKAALGGAIGDNDIFRARLSMASMNRDGFGENLISGAEVSDKEINAVRLQAGAFVSDTVDIQFAFDWLDDQSGVRGAKMLAPNPLAPDYPPLDDRYDVRNGMLNVNDTSMHGLSGTLNWLLGDAWTLKYVVAKRESDTETHIDFDTTPLTLVDVKAFYRDEQLSHELQLNFDNGGRSRGVVGLYYFDGEAGGQVLNHFFNPLGEITLTNPLFGDTQGTVYTDSIAVYGDWTIDLSERWSLDIGARYTDEEKHAVALNQFYLDGTYTTVWGTAANFDKTVDFQNVSPKVSLNFQVNPDIMLYALASRGFKSGGFNIRANTTAVPRSGEPFDDEVVDSFEIGSKMSLLEQTLFLNLSAFHNRYKDIQLSVFTEYQLPDGSFSFFGDFTNAGKGTVNGIEVEYQWLPTRNWQISGNLAWLDAEYDEFITGGVDVSDEQRFTNAPEFSGALNVEYRTELSDGGSLSARAGYSFQSEVWPTTDLSPLIRQGGYGLVNAGVIWKTSGPWTFALQGTNLTDKEYRTTGYNIAAYGVLTGFYGPPRQYTLSARYDF